MKPPVVLLCALLSVFACVSPVREIKPGGDDAVVTFRNGGEGLVELLALSDSSPFFIRDDQVWQSALADVSRIRVKGYSERTGKDWAAGCTDLFIAVLCLDVIAHDAWYFAVAPASGCIVGTPVLFRDEPQVDLRPPLDATARQRLALYCRYPQGLTDAQWQELLGFYHQDTFLSSGDSLKP